MGDAYTPDTVRLLVPMDLRHDPDNLWDDESDYTQQGARAGHPVPPAGGSKLALVSHGEQRAKSTLEIRGHRSGHPGPAKGAGAMLWRYEGNPAVDWRGWDVPSVITAAESLVWSSGVVPGPAHAITLPDGTLLVAWHRYVSAVDTTIVVSSRAPNDGAWTDATAVTLNGASNYQQYPCLCRLPDGTILLYYWVVDGGTSEAQIRLYVSSDDGANWTLGSSFVLRTPVDASNNGSFGSGTAGYDLGRIRAVFDPVGEQLLLLAALEKHDTDATYASVLAQYASDDLGSAFTQVELMTGTSGSQAGGWPDIVAGKNGGFLVGYISGRGANGAAVSSLGSAFDLLSQAAVTDAHGGGESFASSSSRTWDDSDLAFWRDDTGVLYLAGRQPGLSNECIINRSVDEGRTWEGIGNSDYLSGGSSTWFRAGSVYPTNFCIAPQGGRAVVIAQWEGAGSANSSLVALYLGGYSTVTMPGYNRFPVETSRAGWQSTWVAMASPTTAGWTASGSGSDVVVPFGREVTTTANSREFKVTPSGTIAEGHLGTWYVETGDGALGSTAVGIESHVGTGSEGYTIALHIASTGVRLRDVVGAGVDIATLTIDVSAGVYVKLTHSGDAVKAWAREGDTSSDREWKLIGESSSLADDTGSGGANYLRFGHLSTGTATSIWRMAAYAHDEWTGQQLADFVNPDDLFPRDLSTYPVWVDAGFKVSALDGPVRLGEEWTATTRYDYSVDRLHPSRWPSPRQGWRSTALADPTLVNAAQTFAWRVPSVGWGMMTDVVVLLIMGANWRTGVLRGRVGGSWTDVATIDLATGLTGLPYVRHADTLLVDTATANTADHWMHWGAYKDGTVDLGGGVLRGLRWHTEGAWTNAATKRPVLVLDSPDDTEPASGTLNLWADAAMVVIRAPRGTASARYEAWQFEIDSQVTRSGDLRGKVFLSSGIPLSPKRSWGWARSRSHNVELQEWLDGTRFSRRLGASRAAMEMAWVEGVDESELYAAAPNPCYVGLDAGAGADPLGAPAALSSLLDRLSDYLDGPHRMMAYAPSVALGGAGSVTYVSPDRWLYGRMVGSGVRRTNVLGEHLLDEVQRIETIRIEEEK